MTGLSENVKERMEKKTALHNTVTFDSAWLNSVAGSTCELFEKNWLDCASKLGEVRALKECGWFKKDLEECAHPTISYKRYLRMQEERQKRGLPYQQPPPYDTVYASKFKRIVL